MCPDEGISCIREVCVCHDEAGLSLTCMCVGFIESFMKVVDSNVYAMDTVYVLLGLYLSLYCTCYNLSSSLSSVTELSLCLHVFSIRGC